MALASDPYQGHDATVLLTVVLVGPLVLLGLLVYLCSRLPRRRRPAGDLSAAWRDLSLLAVACALALYLWGCLHLLFVDRQERGTECAKVDGVVRGRGAEAVTGDFVPLRLVCHMPGGRSHTVLVPEYINPSVAVLLLLALAGGLASVLHGRARRTAQRKEG
ncbi:hypothetical protein [Streptomyces tanashiensis]|jgi:hypothetical protein|uniref:Integral membrane protein n=1 Tax=Streptomyces tanashiensis TaxID=67367 RepID=A0ABY6RA86_9ACTN|nr:hypothetical protein [Streptomyces tanashiensis]UZX25664.1 hypothetical protein LDH80_35410 [Streptomyces tanashiensis]GGY10914.1 hypothetical protein GCM10010299_13660 [Streptomyces tanashiensis]